MSTFSAAPPPVLPPAGLLLVDPWVNAPAMYATYPALAASRLLPLNLTTAAAVAESRALLPRVSCSAGNN